ncbi:DUF916 domain-containing protein [Dactylosporangium aurantiacum]|uniref:DUF916 domain-containing protein n=1 Tax=Dactylosporangium aurantiacum TaxID=35754 RepID=A0A9Q9IFG2_9ACTN|nr:DUF916 domain-containing protein [Dactylosporangium aurantiacum]MDG6101778.1 DUF916 domain-containing protein [Dactylosporangium aurantiacum]UWZ52414.1 DUF916 domain-containing protein [Dactylosporangium aurantiacum]
MRRLFALVAALAAAAVLTPAAAHAEPADDGNRAWSLRPGTPDGKPDKRTHYTLQGVPGAAVEEQVLVTNSSKVSASFVIYGTDAFNTATGAFDLLPAAQKPTDIGTWMQFPASTVTIDAGATVAVPFKVIVPANATPGDHAGGVVVSLATGTDVKVDTRVAVRVYLRIAGLLRPVLAATKVEADYTGVGNPFGSGSVSVSYTTENTGNIRLRSHPKLVVTSALTGITLAERRLPDLPELLPGQRVPHQTEIGGVFPAGPLTVRVELVPFGDPEQPVGQAVPKTEGHTTIWAWPWLLLLALLILGTGAGFGVRRRLLRRRLARAEAAALERRRARKAAKAGAAA